MALPTQAYASNFPWCCHALVLSSGQTPAGWNTEELLGLHSEITLKGKRVQIAEQYPLHPIHQARFALIKSGKLGHITQAQARPSLVYCLCESHFLKEF